MKQLFATFSEDDEEQKQLNIEAAKRSVNKTEAEKKLLIDEGYDDFVRGGKTAAPGVELGIGLGAAALAKPVLAGSTLAATGNLIKKYPLKSLEVGLTGLSGASQDPTDVALETTGFKLDTMFGGPRPLRLARLINDVFPEQVQGGKRFFSELFGKKELATEGVDNTVFKSVSKDGSPSYSSSKKPLLFKSPQKAKELANYVEEAFQYRQARVQAGGKQNLMKGFDKTILNESGQEYLLVKKSKLKDSKNIASIDNYELKSKIEVEDEIIARSGFEVKQDKDVKFMKMIVSELNKIEQQNPKLYISTLMEYGDKAYLEHKVARRQFSWFWDILEGRTKTKNPDFGKWAGTTNRNTEGNLRLLLDPNYKTLKDTTEVRLKKFDNPKLPDDERLVITIEDPNQAIFSAKSLYVRSNPGNILIKKAGSGETIGVIPDFYRQIYSTQFANAFKKNKIALSGPNIPENLKVKAGESITAYRDRIINKMIDDAIKGKVSMLGYEERYLEELADFYNTFTNLESKTAKPWVRKPSWVEEILETKEFDIPDTEDLTYKPISSLSESEQIKLADLKDNLKTSLENKKVYESQFTAKGKTNIKTALKDKDYRKILRNISKFREEIKNILYPQKSLFDK